MTQSQSRQLYTRQRAKECSRMMEEMIMRTITIEVYDNVMLVWVSRGMCHRFYDWCMILDLISPEDTVRIINCSGVAV